MKKSQGGIRHNLWAGWLGIPGLAMGPWGFLYCIAMYAVSVSGQVAKPSCQARLKCLQCIAMYAPGQIAKPALMCCCGNKGCDWHAGVRKLNSRQLLKGLLDLGRLTSLNMHNHPPDIADEFLRAVSVLDRYQTSICLLCPCLLLVQPAVGIFPASSRQACLCIAVASWSQSLLLLQAEVGCH